MRGYYRGFYGPHPFRFGGFFFLIGAFMLGKVTANHHYNGHWNHAGICDRGSKYQKHLFECQCPNCMQQNSRNNADGNWKQNYQSMNHEVRHNENFV
ncbi:hypothetical protein KGF54_004778 [Candida jiufengensis]|uniref:uncharacterized protein n=1 Tax=Candida jiufengensis TaxID=497108 RepID=UPI0022256758|nr:uncharacterized protein KGF54_004778 [Candida jiufengensis]KAI5951703.1 hypothetical protein KGF54_004778 [Candida jiufengensis]